MRMHPGGACPASAAAAAAATAAAGEAAAPPGLQPPSPRSVHAASQQPAAQLRRLEPNGGPSGSIGSDCSPAGRRACPSAPSWLLHSCCRCRAAPRSAPRFKLSLTAATAGVRLLSRANESGKAAQCNWMLG